MKPSTHLFTRVMLAVVAGLLCASLHAASIAPISLIRGVLLAGHFRTQLELNGMTGDNQRDTLINELVVHTRHDVPFYQRMNDQDLAGAGALLVFLRQNQLRTDEQLKAMSVDNMRDNTINEVAVQTRFSIPTLQRQTNLNLVMLALGPESNYTRGVLLAGGFRTQAQLNAMSVTNKRDNLINELASRTRDSIARYQTLDDANLAGVGALLVFLRDSGRHADAELKTMSAEDLRNTAIVELRQQTGRVDLGELTNMQLAHTAMGVTELPAHLELPELQRPGTHTVVLRVNRSASNGTVRRFSDQPVIGIFTGRGTDCSHGYPAGNHAQGSGAAFSAVAGWGQIEGDGHPGAGSDQCVSWNYEALVDFDMGVFNSLPALTNVERAVLSYGEAVAPGCMANVYTQGGFLVDSMPCWTDGKARPVAKPDGCLALRIPSDNWFDKMPQGRPVNFDATTFRKLSASSWDVTQFFATRRNPSLGQVDKMGFGYMLTGTPLDVKHLDANDNTRCTSLVSDVKLEVTYTIDNQPRYPATILK